MLLFTLVQKSELFVIWELLTLKWFFFFTFFLKSWEIITEDEATMYSNQNLQIPLSQSNCDIQTHLAEELNTRLTTSGSSATGQTAAYTVSYFSSRSNVQKYLQYFAQKFTADRIRFINTSFNTGYFFSFVSMQKI